MCAAQRRPKVETSRVKLWKQQQAVYILSLSSIHTIHFKEDNCVLWIPLQGSVQLVVISHFLIMYNRMCVCLCTLLLQRRGFLTQGSNIQTFSFLCGQRKTLNFALGPSSIHSLWLTNVFLFSLSHVAFTEYSVLRNQEHSSLMEFYKYD